MRLTVALLISFLSVPGGAFGMATEQVGPDREHPTVAQPEWPVGIVALPRHTSRVYSIWVNGNENFYFQANPAQLNELLTMFSHARLRDHEVWLQAGEQHVESFGKQSIGYDAKLRILSGIARAMHEREGRGADLEPQLTLYLDDPEVSRQLVIPDNLILHSEIPGSSLKGKAVKPLRQRWYGRVQVEGGSPALGLGVRIHISLWDDGAEAPIKLTSVGRDGLFGADFSDQELSALKSGKSWLTITVGNWLTEANKTDARFSADKLGDINSAQTVSVPAIQYYYGRILFEDGSAPKLDPALWPGARLMVDFPYAGSAEPDDEGYFKVFFTPGQYEELKSRQPHKNIYIPDRSKTGQSTARAAFPASLLSPDKAQAGVVKIPRP